MQAWKYTMPAFVVPFFFVLDPMGVGVLLKMPAGGTWLDVAWIIFLGFLAISALAAGLQGMAAARDQPLRARVARDRRAARHRSVNLLDYLGIALVALAFGSQLLRSRVHALA
jgi:TRAP-type uncharacterized transport system fused permease subunit